MENNLINKFNDIFKEINIEYEKFKEQLNLLNEQNNNLMQENILLKNTVKNLTNDLNIEKKTKSSSTLWECMNAKLSEKDTIIEQLKKDIEFYKRTTDNKTNIMEKYQHNINIINNNNKSTESNIQLNDNNTFNDIKEENKTIKSKEKKKKKKKNIELYDDKDEMEKLEKELANKN